MSSPPRTPTHRPGSSHRRHPSSLDMSRDTPNRRYSFNRRSSGFSQPTTPRHSHEFEHGSPAQNFDGGGDGGGGMGNLEDELDGLYDDEDDEEGEEEYEEGLPEDISNVGVAVDHDGSSGVDPTSPSANGVRDSGVAMNSSPSAASKATLSPQTARQGGRRHQRQRSLYDGSDYGEDSDLEANEGISAGLEARMAAVESLARRGNEDNGSANDQVVQRLVDRLRDLGSQTGIENGATRLKTAYDSLTTHLNHQSRILSSLSQSILGPLAIPPDPETIDTLLSLINDLLESLPHASEEPLHKLSHLSNSTSDVLQNLSNVSDSVHMSRQTTQNAARRLKTSKDLVVEVKRDHELREQAIHYIEKGAWDHRLTGREAERECQNVLAGFEETCGMWRQRLCDMHGIANVEKLDQDSRKNPVETRWKTKARTETEPPPPPQPSTLQQSPARPPPPPPPLSYADPNDNSLRLVYPTVPRSPRPNADDNPLELRCINANPAGLQEAHITPLHQLVPVITLAECGERYPRARPRTESLERNRGSPPLPLPRATRREGQRLSNWSYLLEDSTGQVSKFLG